MGSTSTVGVFGASGRTGGRILRALTARGTPTRAFTRRPTDVRASEAAYVDFTDPDTLTAELLTGLRAIYVVVPDLPQREGIVTDIVDAAAAAGVERLVLHSVLHPHTRALPHHIAHADAEDAVRHGDVAWTILQPAMYVQSVYGFLVPVANDGDGHHEVPLPWAPDTEMSYVHLGDVAEVAANVLTSEGHDGASYELVGPEKLGLSRMVDIVAAVTGREFDTRCIDAADFAQRIAETRRQAHTWASMFVEYGDHGLTGNAQVLRWLLSREPTTFADAVAADSATENAYATYAREPRPGPQK